MKFGAILLICAVSVSILTAMQNGSFSQIAQAEEYQETRIEVNEQSGIIRFYIKGVEKAQLTSSGLQIYGDVVYTGASRDAGHVVPAPGTPQDDLEGGHNE